jgi:hypothetical protein
MKQSHGGAQLPKIRHDALIRQQSQIGSLEPGSQPVGAVVRGQRSQYAPSGGGMKAIIGWRLEQSMASQFLGKFERVSQLPASK